MASNMIMISLLLSLALVHGARVKNVEWHDQEGREGKRGRKKFVESSGGCKRWCKTQAVGFPLDLELLQKQAQEKCSYDDCKDCEGGGLTIPDCREQEISQEELASDLAEKVSEKEDTHTDAVVGVPTCEEGKDYSGVMCSFNANEMCTHLAMAWCPPPSRNAGATYRQGSKPLCCSGEEQVQESNMDSVQVEIEAIQDAIDVTEEKPEAHVPVCVADHTFEVQEFQRRGKTAQVCRDKDTGRFAKNVCCDFETFNLLKDKETAAHICGTEVKKSHCKPNISTFNGKRNRYNTILKEKGAAVMPENWSCKRMYMCRQNGRKADEFGPVPNQSWCNKGKTGLDKNRPAHRGCFAAKLE